MHCFSSVVADIDKWPESYNMFWSSAGRVGSTRHCGDATAFCWSASTHLPTFCDRIVTMHHMPDKLLYVVLLHVLFADNYEKF